MKKCQTLSFVHKQNIYYALDIFVFNFIVQWVSCILVMLWIRVQLNPEYFEGSEYNLLSGKNKERNNFCKIEFQIFYDKITENLLNLIFLWKSC